MPRISPITLSQADDATAATLNAVKAKIGMIPNLFATFALAPAALNGYLTLSGALEKGRLNARQREVIALAVSQVNSCQYCLSAHTTIGKGAGMRDESTVDARNGRAEDPLENAIADLAVRIVRQHGMLTDDELNAARSAKLNDALIVEIVANVALTIFSNFTNNIATTDVDFPLVNVELNLAAMA